MGVLVSKIQILKFHNIKSKHSQTLERNLQFNLKFKVGLAYFPIQWLVGTGTWHVYCWAGLTQHMSCLGFLQRSDKLYGSQAPWLFIATMNSKKSKLAFLAMNSYRRKNDIIFLFLWLVSYYLMNNVFFKVKNKNT